MDALILSCSTGGGHNACAKAVKEELESRNYNVTMLDPFSLINEEKAKKVGDTYNKTVLYIPKVFGFVYKLGEIYRKTSFSSPVYYLNGKKAKYLADYLKTHHYDVIIMTHMFPAHILAHIDKKLLPKTIFICTDYYCSPFTEESDCDYYVVPSERLVEEFAYYGIEKAKIKPYGIPTSHKFLEVKNKEELLESLNLEKNKKYILVSGGSIGGSNVKKTVKAIMGYVNSKDEYKVIIICGINEKLKAQLEKKYLSNEKVIILGSVNNIHEYMQISSCFIGKPGGLSSTEAAVSEKFLIHMSPIPGVESKNVEFFENNNLSVVAKKPKRDIPELLEKLEDEDFINQMNKNQDNIINKNATSDLAELVEEITKSN